MRDAAFACIRRIGVETGGSNIQFAVDPDDGEHGRDRDEPARVAARARSRRKATGFPIAKIAARLAVGYTPRRDPQRHHRRDAGQLRADHRLRRDQGAPLGVREVPGHPRRARHPDAVGRRGHGHRPHLPRVAAEGAALPRARPRSASTATRPSGPRRARPTTSWSGGPRSPPRTGPSSSRRRCAAGSASSGSPRRRGVDPWFLDQIARIVDERAAPGGARRPAAHGPARDWRRAKRLGFSDAQLAWLLGHRPRPTVRAGPPGRGRAGHLQDGRHLRAPSSTPRTPVPLLDLRGRGRGARRRPARRS